MIKNIVKLTIFLSFCCLLSSDRKPSSRKHKKRDIYLGSDKYLFLSVADFISAQKEHELRVRQARLEMAQIEMENRNKELNRRLFEQKK